MNSNQEYMFRVGFDAGRNSAVDQVATGYFVDVDEAVQMFSRESCDANEERSLARTVIGFILVFAVIYGGLLLIQEDAEAVTPSQPYGGCDEAWQAPRSGGAQWCRDHGWTVRHRLVVSPHRVVKFSTLPSCKTDDGGGPVPCSWNFGTTDGNGIGRAYYVTNPQHPAHHYVWATRPTVHGWQWISHFIGHATSTDEHGYRRPSPCVVKFVGNNTRTKCP